MIHIKSEKELERMRVAGRITALARKAAADAVHPGVTTEEIDRIVRKTIEDAGAKPSFLGYGGFPGSACVSINDEVIHGIPSKTHVVREGDIVKVDVGAYIHGYHGDCAATIPCGEVPIGRLYLKLIFSCRKTYKTNRVLLTYIIPDRKSTRLNSSHP